MASSSQLETYFNQFKRHIVGIDHYFESPYGNKKIVYADWTASGRMYGPIDELLNTDIGAFVANTHTETSFTGSCMTQAYHEAREIIKRHVNATESDVLISSNSGMTGVANKFQRILGLKIHEKYMNLVELSEEDRPIVLCTHMEHHSNQTSWLETLADVEVVEANEKGEVCVVKFKETLQKYKHRKNIYAAVTSCSNVTGIVTPYHEIAKLVHEVGGYCFVDFACSAPYIDIDMHPEDPEMQLDAIYFSPHKFLGGPSSSGILIFNHKLYNNRIPDNPGGGTVDWTNPWGDHKYYDEIEAREDGGTPSFMQTIRVAFCIQLKEKMGVKNILDREHELFDIIWKRFDAMDNVIVFADHIRERLGVFSFYIDGLHYNLAVKMLNDRYGIQVRGGCSCAGTYGHYLLHVSQEFSKSITDKVDIGDFSTKPGWVRMSIHPTMSNEEATYIMDAIEEVSKNHGEWSKDYKHVPKSNTYVHNSQDCGERKIVKKWFDGSRL